MNGSKWIQPVTRTTAPRALVSIIPVAHRSGSSGRDDRQPVSASAFAVAASRFRRDRWSDPSPEVIADPGELHDRLEQWAQPGSRTYVVSPIASDCLTLSDFWTRLTLRRAVWETDQGPGKRSPAPTHSADAFKVRIMTLAGNPTIGWWSTRGRGFVWVSGRQYLDRSEEEIAESLCFQWARPAAIAGTGLGTERDPTERACLWLKAMQSLADWWRLVKGGPFGCTLGQLAYTFFRSRLKAKTVLNHNTPAAKQLEAKAIHGARASVWCYADIGRENRSADDGVKYPAGQDYPAIPGGLVNWDVRSMYPHLLTEGVFPVKLVAVHRAPEVDFVRCAMECQCVIARVVMRARVAEYPLRTAKGTVYPLGQFTTELCGAELARALADDEIESCHLAACYLPGRPFRDAGAELLDMRGRARQLGQVGWELFVKSLSNALSGKLAQRTGRWVSRPNWPAPIDWGEWPVANLDGVGRRRFRALAGLVSEYVQDELTGRPMGAAYAYLVAAGRDRMRQLREQLPERSVVSQDTDGLWTLGGVVEATGPLREHVGQRPGQLHDKYTARHGRFFTARHYVTDRGWILSGLHHFTHEGEGLTFRDRFTLNPVAGSPGIPAASILDCYTDKSLVVKPSGVHLDLEGWAHPLHYRSGRPRDFRAAEQAPAVVAGDQRFVP